MNMQRIISATLLIPVTILFIYFAPPVLYMALVALLAIAAFREYSGMVHVKKSGGRDTFSYLLCAATVALVYYTENTSFALFMIFFSLGLKYIIKDKKATELTNNFFKDITGLLYCAVLPSYIVLIRLTSTKEYIYLLLVAVWSVDTFAYYIGTAYGKRKLAPRISPNKTIEGTAGGFLGAIIVVVVAKYLYFHNFSILQAVMAGITISLFAQVGDLFESLIKRAAGVKDSGTLIPGHGGALDRMDSLLFAAPAFFYFILFLNL